MRPEHWRFTIPLRLRSLFRWAQADQELDDELLDHLDRKTEEYVAQGMTQEEARRRARLDLGGIEQTKEKCRDARRVNWIQDLIQDLHFGLRMLRKSPVFTAVAVVTLALGIGANTAMFGLIDAVMLKMLPVREPEQLVLLSWTAQGHPYMIHSLSGNFDRDSTGNFTSTSFSYPIFNSIRERAQAFSSVLAFADIGRLNVAVGGQADLAQGQLVSGDFFSTLGVPASIGRTLVLSDDSEGASPVAVVSYGYWKRRFGGDPLAMGKPVLLNGIPFTLVGVTVPEFFGVQPGSSTDVWIPLHTQPKIDPGWTAYANPGEVSKFTARDDWWVLIMGRLNPSVTEQQARPALDVIVQQNSTGIEPPPRKDSPDLSLAPPKVVLVPAGEGLDALRREFSQPLFVLMVVVGLVLLLACVNIANLLLDRAGSRQKEIAVRLTLGAARLRLIRQLLTESVLLAVLGGAFGSILAYWADGVLLTFMSSGRTPVILHVSPNLGVLGFTAAVSVLTGVLFGLAPAMRSTRLDLTPALKEGGAKISAGGGLLRGFHLELGNALVVAQVALSVILLIGAGLFVRTLTNLESRNIGFDRRNLLLFSVDPTQVGYKRERLAGFYEEFRRQIEALPGVRSASLSRHTFINGGVTISGVSIEGYTPKVGESNSNESLNLHVNSVGPRFFETFGIPVVLGRTINEKDSTAGPKVGVVNRAFARKYLAGSTPIGRRFGFGDAKASSDIVIVGVVGDALYGQLRDEALPTIYVPYVQNVQQLAEMTFEVRTGGNPTNWIGAVRQAIRGIDENLPLFDIKTQTEQIQQASFQEHLFSRLSSLFGLLALALTSVGLYGMTSYAVSRRTNEIGVRMALGAMRIELLTLIIAQRLRFTLIGVGVGIVGAIGLTRFLSRLLYGVKPTDVLTFTVVSLILTGVAAVASYIPARRAMRVDPMVALRHE